MTVREASDSLTDVLSDHTLSEQYVLGYTTSRWLAADVDRVVIESYGDRDAYVYYRNHNVRAWVDGSTKHVEVPSALVAEQVTKIHRTLRRAAGYEFDIDCRVPTDESIYETTDEMVGAELDAFYDALDPTGHVVLCRPEELLVELLPGDGDSFLDEYIASSSEYLRRIDDPDVTWEDAHEPAGESHPKFQRVGQMIDTIRETAVPSIRMATAKAGVFRGYRFSIGDKTLTLLSRGWGRDMTYAMVSRLLDETTPESVLFTGGCGAVTTELSLNEFVLPEVVQAPDEPPLEIDNVYADDEWVREAIGDHVVHGRSHNVDSPIDETVDQMLGLRDAGVDCVSMEHYGVVKALRDTDVPIGVLLFVMDLPLDGIDLGSTNYDTESRQELTFSGNAAATQITAGWHGLLDRAPATITDGLTMESASRDE